MRIHKHKNFKVGDKIICINEEYSFNILTEGKLYEVDYSYSIDKNNYIKIVGKSQGFYSDRFISYNKFRKLKLEKLLIYE